MKVRALLVFGCTAAALAIGSAASGGSLTPYGGRATTTRPPHDAASKIRPPLLRAGTAFGFNGTVYWTGYIDVAHPNVNLRYVASRFRVPTVTCTSSNSKASFWVGLDGYSNNTIEQAGLSTDCHNGVPYYEDWFEMFPQGTDYMHYVNPGDLLTVTVYYNNGRYGLAVDDMNNAGASFNVSMACPPRSTCQNTSAEAVLEANNGTNLSEFTNVTFTDSAVTSRSGTHGAFQGNQLWDTTTLTMTNSHGDPLADLSGTSDGGKSFQIVYARSH